MTLRLSGKFAELIAVLFGRNGTSLSNDWQRYPDSPSIYVTKSELLRNMGRGKSFQIKRIRLRDFFKISHTLKRFLRFFGEFERLLRFGKIF